MFFWNRSKVSEFENYGWDETDPPPTGWYVQRLFFFAFIVVAGISIGAALYGQSMAEKTLTALVQPVGLIWLGLALVVYFCLLWRRYVAATCCFLCWLLLTVAGNAIVSNSLAASLESRYYHINPYEGQQYQYALLLGGGTSTGPSKRSQVNGSGDRLAVAGRMYHAGQVKKLICSGSKLFENDQVKSGTEAAFEILQGLQVPANDLIPLVGGNTSEEIANLKLWVNQQIEAGNDPGRVALITSAWHLPRAQRLANEIELDAAPMPANFLSGASQVTPNVVVPGAHQILVTSSILKEYMAGLVKR